MIGQVQTKDGQKIVEPISGSIPTGNPVGSFLYTYKKLQPRNYLYCDGSTFNASQYPALYLYLGSNVLPDYRECTMVGAEQNTTDTIATHDVYAQGEFKDDQFQGHFHFPVGIKGTYIGMKPFSLATSGTVGVQMQTNNNGTIYAKTPVSDDVNGTPRFGATTHGKQKAVYVYIKAVDGVDISDEDTFLVTVKNFVEEKNSYSTTEMLTGGKWIDGKSIYRKTFSATGISSSAVTLSTALNNTTITPIKVFGFATNKNDGNFLQLGYTGGVSVLITSSELRLVGNYTYSGYNITIEYTKTTD